MHFLAVLVIDNVYLIWIVPKINNVYYTFIKILYDTFEFGYAGLFYYLLTGNIYSYTESQECIDPTFNFLTINVCGGFRPFIECINLFKYYLHTFTYLYYIKNLRYSDGM